MSYYDGAFRVVDDGVPQRVFIKRSRQLAEQIAMIAIARDAGSEIELDDAPAFNFKPAELDPEKVIARRGSAPVPKAPPAQLKAYYGDGVRKVVKGIPVRLARHAPNHSLNHWAGAAPMSGHSFRVAQFAKALEEKQAQREAMAKALERPEPLDLPLAA